MVVWRWCRSVSSQVLQAPSGGGGLLSTVNDYMKFARMLQTGRGGGRQILKLQTLAMMREDNLGPRNIAKLNLASYFDGFGACAVCAVLEYMYENVVFSQAGARSRRFVRCILTCHPACGVQFL